MAADFENTPINSEDISCKERIVFNDTAWALCTYLAQSAQAVAWN